MTTPKPTGRTMITLGVSVTQELKARIPRLPNGLQDQEWLRAAIEQKLAMGSEQFREGIDKAYVTAYHQCKASISEPLSIGAPVEFRNPHDAGIDAVCETLRKLGE